MSFLAKSLHPVAAALRKAGFVPLPHLWVRPTDIPRIHKIAEESRETVNAIRGEVRKTFPLVPKDQHRVTRGAKSNPKQHRNAAWDAYKKMQDSK